MSEFWIQTFGGREFDLLESGPQDIDILDIAHALARQCRYNGHTSHHYSVAQHSCLVSQQLEQWVGNSRELLLWGLLHDAAEAYVGDVVSPVKRLVGGFGLLERRIQNVICERFGLELEPPDEVKDYDLRLLATERRDLMGPCARDWNLKFPPLDLRIMAMSPLDAKQAFLSRFESLVNK